MAEVAKSKFWLDLVARDIIEKYPKGEIIVSSGISPSASYHIGHFREILTADALTWGIRKSGRKARHIHVVDNFDPLRKRYDFLPEWLEEYVGQPICFIPAPDKSQQTYADYFYNEFELYARAMGIYPDVVVKSYEDLYKPGKMAPYFEQVLQKLDKVQKIFKEVSNRELEPGWTPIQVIGEDGRFFNATLDTWDKERGEIGGKSYKTGEAKLNWRLDWPARWAQLGVMVEPFGRELASAGSAYDTGTKFAKEIFGIEAPLPAAKYESIHLPGDPKKMSSSLGNLITPQEALEIMPPEILRYFVVRSRPERTLYFDSGEGLYNLLNEFSEAESSPQHEFKEAYQFAVDLKKSKERTISTVSFKHLVSVYQAGQKNSKAVLDILRRTGYEKAVGSEKSVILSELKYIDSWLKKYAPKEVKFSVQKQLSPVELSPEQKDFLAALGQEISSQKVVEAQWVHDTIYKLGEQFKLQPADAFRAIYRVILAKDSGPKAGWFLASLDKAWLVKRLQLQA